MSFLQTLPSARTVLLLLGCSALKPSDAQLTQSHTIHGGKTMGIRGHALPPPPPPPTHTLSSALERSYCVLAAHFSYPFSHLLGPRRAYDMITAPTAWRHNDFPSECVSHLTPFCFLLLHWSGRSCLESRISQNNFCGVLTISISLGTHQISKDYIPVKWKNQST